jgi:hypothetical protein
MVVEEAWKELLQLWSISWQMKVQQFEVTYLWGIPLKKTASLLWNHFQFWFWLYPREQHCKLTSFFTCPLSVHLSACWSMTFHIGEPPHTKDDMDDIPAALQFPWGALRSLPRWSGILEDRVPSERFQWTCCSTSWIWPQCCYNVVLMQYVMAAMAVHVDRYFCMPGTICIYSHVQSCTCTSSCFMHTYG